MASGGGDCRSDRLRPTARQRASSLIRTIHCCVSESLDDAARCGYAGTNRREPVPHRPSNAARIADTDRPGDADAFAMLGG